MTPEHRTLPTRRKADIVTLGLLTTVGAIGIAWGTATAAMSQKVDRAEFIAHVIGDSVRSVGRDAALRRIESKLDSTNDRLSRLICNRQPAYCR